MMEPSEQLKGILEALSIIKDLPENKGKIKCPKCGKDLHYRRAQSNGHVWGQCESQDCLGWL